ncbi:hypothetical protein GW924_01590 [Candidatus Pacearchaeota archaeon]|nr:hypothetical protein [Candidatus Pacearchaeota archaeon]
MAFKRFNRDLPPKTIGCSCGGEAKLSSRRNYPFGAKSDPVTSKFYKCKSCKKIKHW